jgi:hypothetical protein
LFIIQFQHSRAWFCKGLEVGDTKMSWAQQIVLWSALPLLITLIVTTINALRTVNKAQGEDNDCNANQGHGQQLV